MDAKKVLQGFHELRQHVADKPGISPEEKELLLSAQLHFTKHSIDEMFNLIDILAHGGRFPLPGEILGQTWNPGWEFYQPSYVTKIPAVNVYPNGVGMNSFIRCAHTLIHELGHVITNELDDHSYRWENNCWRLGAVCHAHDPAWSGDDQTAWDVDLWPVVNRLSQEYGS